MILVLIVTFTFEFKGLYDCLLPAQAKCLAFSPGAYGKLMQSIELPMVASIPPPTTCWLIDWLISIDLLLSLYWLHMLKIIEKDSDGEAWTGSLGLIGDPGSP